MLLRTASLWSSPFPAARSSALAAGLPLRTPASGARSPSAGTASLGRSLCPPPRRRTPPRDKASCPAGARGRCRRSASPQSAGRSGRAPAPAARSRPWSRPPRGGSAGGTRPRWAGRARPRAIGSQPAGGCGTRSRRRGRPKTPGPRPSPPARQSGRGGAWLGSSDGVRVTDRCCWATNGGVWGLYLFSRRSTSGSRSCTSAQQQRSG
mmetsp:Transcript_18952/g.47343  ORF Transcript_18952/g.47343 Transcript_18952/m.47343 type:complete len:208 (-) Transcript_18952:59-682(-)